MTIEDLKKHCIKTIKMSEAIESIPNVKITDSRSLQEHKMVLKLIEAWEKVKAEIEKTTSRYTISRECGVMGQVEWCDRLIKESEVLQIIDKHLKELEGATDG